MHTCIEPAHLAALARPFHSRSTAWILAIAMALGLEARDASAQGLPSQTWPAGTQLSMWNHGGRITTFHRGYLYLGGTEGQGTWTYNIANPTAPRLVRTVTIKPGEAFGCCYRLAAEPGFELRHLA